MINEIQYINAELLYILNQFPSSSYKQIPSSLIEKISNNIDINYYNSLNKDKIFYKTNLSNATLEKLDEICTTYLKDYNLEEI